MFVCVWVRECACEEDGNVCEYVWMSCYFGFEQ